MSTCVQCGHELGVGRFCTNCGHPVGTPASRDAAPDRRPEWRTDTAERPRVLPPRAPPPAPSTPEPPRYPLFADEVSGAERATETASLPVVPVGPEPEPEAEPPSRPRHVDEARRQGAAAGWVPWVAGLTAMLVLATIGLWLLLGNDDEPAASDSARDSSPGEKASRDGRTPEGRHTVSPEPPAEPGDLAASATVTAPRPAPATQDVNGSKVTFVAANMLDGVPQTCWRTPGDGTGKAITFGFDEPVQMTEVGLINGYAKIASDASGTYDWYAGNRRILEVEWTFDDGTVVSQDLEQTRRMQTVTLDKGVVTEQVTMRLLEVTPPGTGRASRNNTAISEVFLQGAAAD
jgi:hypothetical protein